MTTATTNTTFDHSGSAGFQAWIQEFDSGILTGGHWVNTSDTGQLTLASATKPGSTNSAAGYRMYRMNDALQSSAPVFMKVEYGNGGSTAIPAIFLTFSTATDGAGNCTGLLTTRTQVSGGSVGIINTTLNYVSSFCALDGYLGISFKESAQLAGKSIYLNVKRTTDDNGADTASGLYIEIRAINNVNMVCMNFTNSTVDTTMTSSAFCYTFGRTSTLVAGVPQAFKHYGWFPKARPNLGACTFLSTEVSAQQTTTFKLIGNSTARTYKVVVNNQGATDNSNSVYAILWE